MKKQQSKTQLKEDIKKLDEKKERLSISIAKQKATASALNFKKEFKKSMKTALVAALGFLIALVWKDLITEFVTNLSSASPIQGKLISALLVTVICVLGIMLVAKLLEE